MKKLKKSTLMLFVATFAVTLFSCKKDDDNSANVKYLSESNMHIAGTQGSKATVWKYKEIDTLTSAYYSAAYAICRKDNDDYVAGYCNDTAFVWKNKSKLYKLNSSTRTAKALSLTVANGNVYAVGYEKNSNDITVATIWQNGNVINLTDGTYEAQATSVFVNGGDVYVAGYEVNSAGKAVAKFWKNGNATNLTDGNRYAQAYSVFVADGNVYVAGREANGNGIFDAKLWKNGYATTLSDGKNKACAYSVYASGGNVYVAGTVASTGTITIATLWKNGENQNIVDSSTTYTSEARFVTVSNGDVYVGGSYGSYAKVWKNGEFIADFSNNVGTAYSIAIF